MTASNDKTGSVFTGVSHGVCALIGAGVLALPNAVAAMGWVAGLLCLLAFYIISVGASIVLANLYEVDGKKYGSYGAAVKAFMGKHGKIWVTICQTLNIVCFCIAYTITGAVSMKAMSEQICKNGGSCIEHTWALALIFGGMQLFCSQLPNLEEAWWMSAIGAAMSIGYSSIALGMSIAHADNHHGTVGGIETSTANKVFSVFNGLGSIAFAFSFSVILLEIQDTLREPPKAVKTMKKVVHLSLGISAAFYLVISITGYLALGNSVPGDVLTGFTGPSWVICLGNAMVVVHMIAAYQVYAQPLFVLVEWELWVRIFKHKAPEPVKHTVKAATSFDEGSKHGSIPDESSMRKLAESESEGDIEQPPSLSPDIEHHAHQAPVEAKKHKSPAPFALRLLWRTCYVGFTTIISCIMPFFSNFVGLIGGLLFWPLCIGFPLVMWLRVRKPTGWRKHGALVIAFIMLLVGIAATIGSLRNIVVTLSSYEVFG
ncbi:hypothetical protein N2152v2_003205 [Parachlorella kessleri]